MRPYYYQWVKDFWGPLPQKYGVVLLYHSINQSSNTLCVSPHEFQRQMEHLARNFEVVSLPNLARLCLETGNPRQRPLAAITFDDGFLDNLQNAAPILSALSLPATIFVTSGLVGKFSPPAWGESLPIMSWDQIGELLKMGFSLGGHTMTHPSLPRLSRPEMLDEIRANKIELEQRFSRVVDTFAYPTGHYDTRSEDCVREAGFRLAVTTKCRSVKAKDSVYLLPRVGIGKFISFPHYCALLSLALDKPAFLWP